MNTHTIPNAGNFPGLQTQIPAKEATGVGDLVPVAAKGSSATPPPATTAPAEIPTNLHCTDLGRLSPSFTSAKLHA